MSTRPERYLLLYLPWLLSLLFTATPVLSYCIAWLGSFYIFYMSIGGKVKPLPGGLNLGEQLMRPLFLPQIIFAGYMCCTSVFYFLDVLGYENFTTPPPNYFVDLNQLELVARCQRYYCLAHAALVTGILNVMQYPKEKKYALQTKDMASFLMLAALVCLAVSSFFKVTPGLYQFYVQFNALSIIAATLALAFAIPLKKGWNTLFCLTLYLMNFYQALLSGFKEPIIISILVLGIFLYPFYKKAIITTFVPAIILLFMFLPAYNRAYREKAWANEEDSESASQAALEETFNKQPGQEDDSNWAFLTNRFSEIGMFTQYVKSTPKEVDHYGLQIFYQGFTVLIPRIFWPEKPFTEEMVMERAYNAGVIQRGATVSAKPPLVVDAYLSGGSLGIFLILFLFGTVIQLISVQAEKLFSGYIIGTAFIYSGLFQITWRGNSIEILMNSVLWAYVSMLMIFQLLRAFKILHKVPATIHIFNRRLDLQ